MITLPGRVPITIQPWFILLAALLGGFSGQTIEQKLAWMLIVFFSVLLHEFGHAWTALFFGQEAKIELTGTGGLTIRRGPNLAHWQHFLVVLNGPLMSALLGVAAYTLTHTISVQGILLYILTVTWMANAFWCVLNLLPVPPLDGGMLMGILLEKGFGHRGFRANFLIGGLIGLAIMALSFVIGEPIVGFIFFLLSFESLRVWRASREVAPQDRDYELQQLYRSAEKAYLKGDAETAEQLFHQVRAQTGQGILYRASAESLALMAYEDAQFALAYELLLPHESELSPDGVRMLHRAAFYQKDPAVVIRLGPKSYEMEPSYETAYVNALAHGLLGEAEQAVGWLSRAVEDGLPDLVQVAGRSEFDRVRSSAEFQSLINS